MRVRAANVIATAAPNLPEQISAETILDHQRRARRQKLWSVIFLIGYGVALLFLIANHEVFRDEVRAYSIARTATNPIDLVRTKLIDEGHPSLWYLVLWFGSRIWDNYAVLKIASFLSVLGLVSIVLLMSPFPVFYRCLFALGTFPLHDFSVVSRGYGIDAVLILLLAVEYSRTTVANPWRTGGYNALLANSSVYGAMVACAYILVRGSPYSHSRRPYFPIIGSLTFAGLALSIYTVWPTHSNVVMQKTSLQSLPADYGTFASEGLRSLFAVLTDRNGWTGYILTGYGLQTKFSQLGYGWLGTLADIVGVLAICALLIQWPRLLLAFGFSFVAAGLFSNLVYPASNVHIAIIGTYLFALLWIAWVLYYKSDSRYWRFISYALGFSLFFHATDGLHTAWIDLHKPFSSSKAAGAFLKHEYPNAVVICEPDVFCESLPYYSDNNIYLVREARFSRWVQFVAPFNRTVTLREIMDAAARLRALTGQIVIVSLPRQIEEFEPGHFNWAYGRALEVKQPDLQRFRRDFAEVKVFTEGFKWSETYVFYKERLHPL